MPTAEELAAQAAAAATTQTENDSTGDAPGSEAAKPATTSGERLFSQADLDRLIDDRLKREREKATKAQEKLAQEADERRKVEAGEFQKLAEERKTQLEQLTPKAELAARLSEIVAKQLEAELATWPESVRAIMPKDEAPLLERIEWAERTRPLAQELLVAQGNGQAQQGMRYPAQGTGSNGAQATGKTVAQNTLNKAYAPRKPAS